MLNLIINFFRSDTNTSSSNIISENLEPISRFSQFSQYFNYDTNKINGVLPSELQNIFNKIDNLARIVENDDKNQFSIVEKSKINNIIDVLIPEIIGRYLQIDHATAVTIIKTSGKTAKEELIEFVQQQHNSIYEIIQKAQAEAIQSFDDGLKRVNETHNDFFNALTQSLANKYQQKYDFFEIYKNRNYQKYIDSFTIINNSTNAIEQHLGRIFSIGKTSLENSHELMIKIDHDKANIEQKINIVKTQLNDLNTVEAITNASKRSLYEAELQKLKEKVESVLADLQKDIELYDLVKNNQSMQHYIQNMSVEFQTDLEKLYHELSEKHILLSNFNLLLSW